MGKEFDEQHSSIQHHHFFHLKTTFLPMFCRLSIKDIKLNHHRRHRPTLSDEPSSPKVSCMGQVKRNNRVTALPAATNHHTYSKLKKLFSSKTLLPPTTTTATATAGRTGSKSCRSSSRQVLCSANNLPRLKLQKDDSRQGYVDVGRLDPPLPVVKKAAPPPDEVNLWRRRSDGAALKTLQIKQINLPNTNSQPTTV